MHGSMENLKSFLRALPLALLIVFSPARLMGDESQGSSGMTAYTELELQLSSVPEARLRLNQFFIFPFLQGSGPLTKDNNIELRLSADITPISLAGIGEVTWTPAAFLQFSGGGQAGSGWNMPLGNGIGLRKAPVDLSPPADAVIEGEAFGGLIWHGWGAATFQFDLAAIYPGDWNHIIFQTRQEFRYSEFTRAGPDDYWIFEGDDGENRNGWKYRPSYTLGYMILRSSIINFIGIRAEMEKPLYGNIEEIDWGGELGKWFCSALINYSVNPRFNVLFAFQLRTRRNHGLSDFSNKKIYYQDLPIQEEGGNRQIFFHRVAAILSYKLF